MLKLFLLFSLFISPLFSFSQDAQIVFDVNSVSNSPYIVDSNRWIVESSTVLADYNSFSNVINPSILVRKYLAFKTELRVNYNYSSQMMGMLKQNQFLGYNFFALGFKKKLWTENGKLPEASFILNSYYPLQRVNSFSKNKEYNLETCFQFQNNITDFFAVNYNLGAIFTNQYKSGILNYTVCATGLIHKDIEAFVEGFGYMNVDRPHEYGYDLGVIYYPNKWSQAVLTILNNYYEQKNYASVMLAYSFSMNTD